MKHVKHYLPELDDSLPDNDFGGMVAAVLICFVALALLLRWWHS